MNSSSGSLAGEELRGLRLEVVELALQDRDHVPGHVLQDLGVLERAALGGDGNWLHLRNLLIRVLGPGGLFEQYAAGQRTILG